MDDEIDDYDSIVFTNDELRQLDAVASPTRPLPPGKPNYGSDAYFTDYKVRLARKVEEITKFKPYDWQLDSAVATHTGRDVFILAGTGCGKTLPFIANCFMDKKMLVFLVSPLNALANQQAKTFKAWGVEAFAVNSTTRYPELYKDIHAGRYQVIISSIEAFTDTTRLLPVVKSPSLAKRGRQLVVLDEAHCMDRWGKTFRPKYATVGDLRLLVTHEVPWIAATATASEATRKVIKTSLRFQDDALVVNLGNRKLNLAYSVHRMKRAASSIPEILDYFPSKTELPGYTLIFVQSRQIGQLVLYLLRQHVAPEIRYQIQIYHAFRSDYTKEIIALAFEMEGGFRVIICTEALTMGVDFRKVSLVIHVMAPTDGETLTQRSGRGGRDPETICDVVLMAQESMFEDTKQGQKRLLKSIKKEEPVQEEISQPSGSRLPTRRAPREYEQVIIDFINTIGCRVEVLDKEFENPAWPEGELCLCDFHLKLRGEPTLRERRLQEKDQSESTAAQIVEVIEEEQGEDEQEEESTIENLQAPDELSGPVDDLAPVATKRQRGRPAKDQGPYLDALEKWRDLKFNSPECKTWNADEEFVLSDKVMHAMAKHPGVASLQDLASLKPPWTHYKRWGDEIIDILHQVQLQQDEENARKKEDKKRKRNSKKQAVPADTPLTLVDVTHSVSAEDPEPSSGPVAGPSSRPDNPVVEPKPKRRKRNPNASEAEKAAWDAETAEMNRQRARDYYQRKKNSKAITTPSSVKIEEDAVASTSSFPQDTLESSPSIQPVPIITFHAKQELVDHVIDSEQSGTPATPTIHPPATPVASGEKRSFSFNVTTLEDMQRQYPTPNSQPRANVGHIGLDPPQTPSQPKRHPRKAPNPKFPPNNSV